MPVQQLLPFTLLIALPLIAASVGLTSWLLREQRGDALMIHLAGRQRMLAQPLAQEAVGIRAGAGFDPRPVWQATASLGLPGMRERAELLGGRLAIESAPGAGTRLTAELPLSGGAPMPAQDAPA